MISKRPRLSLLAIILSLAFLGFLILSPTGTSLSVEKIGKAGSHSGPSPASQTSPDELSDPSALKGSKDSSKWDSESLKGDSLNAEAAKEAESLTSEAAKSSADNVDKEEEAVAAAAAKSKDKPSTVADVAKGKPIMKKMGNETVKAELGRAAWKVFHTILAQYPDEPDKEQQNTLINYIHLFSRVYPCRECAEHFQILLEENPPQVSTKKVAMFWGCHVHNKVNKRLGKEIFDCAYIGDKYDCGCAEDADEKVEKTVPAVKGG